MKEKQQRMEQNPHPLVPSFVHLCPSSVPKNPSLMKNEWSAESNSGVPICCPFLLSSSLSLSLFSPSIILSAQSVSLLSSQYLYSDQLKSHHHYPFLPLPLALYFILPSICPSPIFCSFSISSFLCSFFSFFFFLVPGPYPGYQLRPLQPYLFSSVPSFGSFF